MLYFKDLLSNERHFFNLPLSPLQLKIQISAPIKSKQTKFLKKGRATAVVEAYRRPFSLGIGLKVKLEFRPPLAKK